MKTILFIMMAAMLVACSKPETVETKPVPSTVKIAVVSDGSHTVTFRNSIGDVYVGTFVVLRNENHPNGVVAIKSISRNGGVTVIPESLAIDRYLAWVNNPGFFTDIARIETFRTIEAVILAHYNDGSITEPGVSRAGRWMEQTGAGQGSATRLE